MDFFAAPSDVAAKLVRITEIQPDLKHDFDVPNDVPETPSLDAYEHDARVIPDDEADSAATATAEPTEQVAAKPLELDNPSTWEGLPIPEREWHAETLIPHRTVTLLSGDGGTGKSLLTLQLAVATALGSLWIGRKVAAGRALFLTAEDEMEEVHRRLAGICAAEGARLADLGNLRVKSLADNEDAVLAAPTGKAGLIKGTPLWSRLVASCEEFRPRLLVLDNAADLFAGGENDRAQVRQFIAMLRRLAIRLDMTVLLLSHPSLTGL